MKTKYKFRAECAFDAQAIRTTLLPWIHDWFEARDNLKHEGNEYGMPEVVVEFSINEGGLNQGEILWLMDGIENCHIAADTLAKAEEYTGERNMRPAYDASALKPSEHVYEAVKNRVLSHQKVLRIELQRVMQQYANYETVRKYGSPKEGNSPGWIAVANHPPTGLTKIIRVTGKLNGKKKLPSGDGPIKERMVVIEA